MLQHLRSLKGLICLFLRAHLAFGQHQGHGLWPIPILSTRGVLVIGFQPISFERNKLRASLLTATGSPLIGTDQKEMPAVETKFPKILKVRTAAVWLEFLGNDNFRCCCRLFVCLFVIACGVTVFCSREKFWLYPGPLHNFLKQQAAITTKHSQHSTLPEHCKGRWSKFWIISWILLLFKSSPQIGNGTWFWERGCIIYWLAFD